jgi:hypothetical protein
MRAALDAFGAGDNRRCLGEMWRERRNGLAQILRRCGDQDDIGGGGTRDIAGDFNAGVQ